MFQPTQNLIKLTNKWTTPTSKTLQTIMKDPLIARPNTYGLSHFQFGGVSVVFSGCGCD